MNTFYGDIHIYCNNSHGVTALRPLCASSGSY